MKILLALLTCGLLFACSGDPAGPAPTSKDALDARFDAFKHAYLESFWQLNPEWALYNGRYEFAGQLTVPDAQQRARAAEFYGAQAALLAGFDLAGLSQTNKGDYAILDNEIRSAQWYAGSFREYAWNPSRYNVAGPIGLILNTDYAPLDNRLLAIGERLKSVPAYYQAARANLDQPALPQTRLAIEQNQAAEKLLSGRLQQAIDASGLSDQQKSALNAANQQAQRAVADYAAFLSAWLPALEAGEARDFRIGEALYEQKFQYDIVSDYSAKQIYQLALAEKDRLHGEMDRLATELWDKYLSDEAMPDEPRARIARIIAEVAKTHAPADQFVAEVQAQIPELEAFVAAYDLLDIDPDKPLVVRETPEYDRGFSIASIEAPGPYDSSANTYYNVEPVTDKAPELQASHLREYNQYTMQILNIHEAVPGHYTQLVHANKSPSLIKAIFGNGAMVEGWAVYTERMMLEQGYGNDQPELWLMYYKWNLRTVVNTLLDYAIQVQGLDEQGALDLLMNGAFQEEAEARGKWRRANLSQVQLTSYFTGYREIYDFRESQKAALGERFDLKTFHNDFLSYGSAPVNLIKSAMLAQQRGQ